MVILGVHDGHNCSATVLVDGQVVAAVNEERLTRRKSEYGFPDGAVTQCLRLAGVDRRDISSVALSTRELPPKYFLTNRNATFNIEDYWREQREYWHPRINGEAGPAYLDVFKDKIDRSRFPYDESLIDHEDDTDGMREARIRHLAGYLGLARDRITVYDHHSCHAYYGYGASVRRARPVIVFTVDGAGDRANATVWLGEPGRPLVELNRTDQCNIGRMYRYATLLLGMKQNEHEYKLMGLAPYSNSYIGGLAYQAYAETLQVDGLNFRYQVRPKDHFFHFKEKLESVRFDGIAWGLQRRTEELLAEWMANGRKQTGVRDVVFAGGVALNVKANQRVWEAADVDSFFVPPGPGDESISLGAAYQDFVVRRGGSAPMDALVPLDSAYLGTDHSDIAIQRALEESGVSADCTVRRVDVTEVADVLAGGAVVARFAGRMEFGPRALGNRSILADPRRPEQAHVINKMIKQRDFWMPFAPSVLAERADDYLVNPKRVDARFMAVAFDTTAEGREALTAAVHAYDGTARPQVVTPRDNAEYHALLCAFAEKTGVAALLNTSFNLHGEPIVESPVDAISTFQRSGLPNLLLGQWLVSKRRLNG